VRADNQQPTTSRLYAELLNESPSAKIDGNDHDVQGTKSRWVKWTSVNLGNQNTVVYNRVNKSDSSLLARLWDRLNYWSGNARCAARNELINELKKNGLEVTDDIKKSLPDRWKLGNANDLRDSIKAAVKNKKDHLNAHCKRELAEPMEKYMSAIANGDITASGIINGVESQPIIDNLVGKMRPIFNSQLNYFLDSLMNALVSADKPLQEIKVESIIKNQIKIFSEVVFKSQEINSIKDQFEDAYQKVSDKVKAKNWSPERAGKLLKPLRSISSMKPLDRIDLSKPIKLALAQQASKLFEEKALDEQVSVMEKISDKIGTEEFSRVFELITNSLLIAEFPETA
jgi:hypothetical protein